MWLKSNMKKLLLIFFCISLLASCRQKLSETEQVQELETRVLQVHDEAMGKMDRIFILRQDLKKLRDSLGAQTRDTVLVKSLERHILLLQKADDNMMKWMHWYKSPEKTQPRQEALRYLEQQLLKIEQVQKTMDSTLTAARQLHQKHDSNK